jgi:hypothetical protein
MTFARPARLQHAMLVAPDAGSVCAPEIALLALLQAAVAAGHDSLAGLSRDRTNPPGLDATGARTSIVVVGVVVVAGLARLTNPVAAGDGRDARLSRNRTGIVRLDLAGSRAAIAADAIAVVAGLAPIGLYDPISTIGARVDDRIALAAIGRTGLAMGACIGELNRAWQREAPGASGRWMVASGATLTDRAPSTLRFDRSIGASHTYK